MLAQNVLQSLLGLNKIPLSVVRPDGGITVKVVVSVALSVYISSLATVPLGRLASGRGGGRG